MNYPELEIKNLKYDDEFFAYSGRIELDGHEIGLHFPLCESMITEIDLIARHRPVLELTRSRLGWLVSNAQGMVVTGEILPPIEALIICDDTFELQFGSSIAIENHWANLWYEALYENDGTNYYFKKHLPGIAGDRR